MKKTMAIVVILSVVAFGSASADNNSTPDPKEASAAIMLSLGGTLFLPIVGPGLGHIYAHNMGQFYLGTVLRSLAVGLIVTGGIANSVSWGDADSRADMAITMGVVLYLGSSVFDIATAGKSANRYNRKHGLAGIDISPTYFASRKAFGVQVSMGF
ncbi:MAG: hypothetical protein PVH24_01975 [Candidatus Zixiibacteriota bacterium]|jgi:hypothetical protein